MGFIQHSLSLVMTRGGEPGKMDGIDQVPNLVSSTSSLNSHISHNVLQFQDRWRIMGLFVVRKCNFLCCVSNLLTFSTLGDKKNSQVEYALPMGLKLVNAIKVKQEQRTKWLKFSQKIPTAKIFTMNPRGTFRLLATFP